MPASGPTNAWGGRIFRGSFLATFGVVAGLLPSAPLLAQLPAEEPLDRPGASRPVIPAPGLPGDVPFVLPRVTPPPAGDTRLSQQLRVFVRRVRVTGNTVLPEAEIAALTGPYENREMASEELHELRDRLTRLYVDRGYVSSGAVLPDQEIREGEVEYRVVEGRLDKVEIEGNQRLRTDYITGRIFLDAGPPLNLQSLQRRLQLLQQSGLFDRINAELTPGILPGEGILRVAVEEARPWQLALGFGNNRSPGVGSNRGEIGFTHRNLTGHGDSLGARAGMMTKSSQLDWSLDYSLPVNRHDTAVFLRHSESEASVVESPFDLLNIRNPARASVIGVSQPLWQTPGASLSVALAKDFRVSQTLLLGQPFSFSAGIPDGRSEEQVWRFSQDWLRRGGEQVVALRSVFSVGETNSTDKIAGIGPDRSFAAWLAQFQWARRFPDTGGQLIFRTDLLYTRDSLISLEKLSLGGAGSVRGFRESLFLRDRGVISSLEYRHPVVRGEAGATLLQLAPFVDYGTGSNSDPTPDRPKSIYSAGLGLIWTPHSRVQAALYYGHGWPNVPIPNKDLQDRGGHFLVGAQFY